MKQPIALAIFILFIAGVTFVLAQQEKQGGKQLTASLTGSAEVPGPGDPDGMGTAKITLNQDQGQVCFELAVSNIDNSTAAHIHAGAVDVAGPVLLSLAAPANGSSKDCVLLEKDKIADIMRNPANYYVNVHNAEFPNGAIRGQLGK